MKPQLLALARHLNRGHEVTRASGFDQLGIQNLTARLSELTSLGFDIIMKLTKANDRQGRPIKVASWSFRNTFNPGDLAEVVKDMGTYIPLRGKVGKVIEISMLHAQATLFIDGVGFRRLGFKTLRRHIFKPGDAVRIDGSIPLVIGEYYPNCRSYLLHTPDNAVTLVAHPSTLLPRPSVDNDTTTPAA